MEELAQSISLVIPGIENGADLSIMATMIFFVIVGFVVVKVKGGTFF
jgi:hypothetical protein